METNEKEKPGFFFSLIVLLLATLLFWAVYCLVMPQVWPNGPANVVHPGYWLTFAIVWLVRQVRNLFMLFH